MMNSFIGLDARNRRSLLNKNSFPPVHFPISNYSTNAQTKESMKHTYDGLFINNLHLIPDPLKKNLADSVITDKDMNMTKTKEYVAKEVEKPPSNQSMEFYPKLSGLINMFSGVISVMGAMFQKRESSPAPQYYDCFETEYLENTDLQMSGSVPWQSANYQVQNNNGRAHSIADGNNQTNWKSDMIADCKSPLTEDQINQVCLLLNNESNYIQIPCSKQQKSFEPSSADVFEDAFCPDEFSNLSADSYLEYHSPFCYQQEELFEAYAANVKTEQFKESTHKEPEINENVLNIDKNVVSSCEDKLNKLKALLKSKCTKNKDNLDNEDGNGNIKGTTDTIAEDTIFGNEINIADSKSSHEHDHFDEVTGKFYSSSVESDDSFQIVFTDDTKATRQRFPSECESEDSFIVFEESPDSCYISDDVFGDVPINECSDSEISDTEDSGCTSTKLLPTLSRTVEDLTDDGLYGEDVVDYSVRVGEHYNQFSDYDSSSSLLPRENTGNKKEKKPLKKVHFSPLPPKVHVMRVWAYAARQARIGEWEQHARDRDRFKSRINDVEMAISWVLKPKHRNLVMFQRFMPWWNAQKRKELEEKKQLAEQKQQEEQKQLAEQKQQEEQKQLAEQKQQEVQKQPEEQKQLEEQTQLEDQTQLKDQTQLEAQKQLEDQTQPKDQTQLEAQKQPKEQKQLEEEKQLKDQKQLECEKQLDEPKHLEEQKQLKEETQLKEKKEPDKINKSDEIEHDSKDLENDFDPKEKNEETLKTETSHVNDR